MDRVKALQEALTAARMERAVAHAKFRQAEAKAARLAADLLAAKSAAAKATKTVA